MRITAKMSRKLRMQGPKRSHDHRREPWREVKRKLEVANAKIKRLQSLLEDANADRDRLYDLATASEEQAVIYETDFESVLDEIDELKTALKSIAAVQVDPAGKRGMTLFDALTRCKQIAAEALKED